MKKFKFNLEKLLEIRRKETHQLMEKMAPFVNEYNKVVHSKERALKNLSDFSAFKNSEDELDQIALNRLRISYQLELRKLVSNLEAAERSKEQEVETYKRELGAAKKKEKILELVREQRYKKWKKKRNKFEEKNQEEMVLKMSRR